jgi:WD40 repeat protein
MIILRYVCLQDTDGAERLGLFAVACNDGTVRLLSLPLTSIPEGAQSSPKFATFTPNATLRLFSNNTNNSLFPDDVCADDEEGTSSFSGKVTCVDWSHDDMHTNVVGGTTTGLVALWNLTTKDPVLFTKRKTGYDLLPIRVFKAHSDFLTCVRFCPG